MKYDIGKEQLVCLCLEKSLSYDVTSGSEIMQFLTHLAYRANGNTL